MRRAHRAVRKRQHARARNVPTNRSPAIVVQADLYNAAATAPNANVRAFQANLQRLKLDVATIVGIHGNPAPMSQFQGLVNKTQ
jgi:hypothetical protein